MNNTQKLRAQLDAQKARLDSYRPFPAAIIKNLHEWFRVELTYASNALEGNTLTSSETAIVIEKGITIGGKSLKEHLEAINHAHAFDYVVSLAQTPPSQIQWQDILSIHRLVLKGIDDDNAGRLRAVRVAVSGSSYQFPEPYVLQDEIEQFMAWLHTTQEHPFLIAADAHLKLVTIHPFVDGNGRTARLLMNLILFHAGFPPALIMPEDRASYISALARYQSTGDTQPYYEIIAHAIERSFEIYFRLIT